MRRIVELHDGTAYCETCDTDLQFIAEACKCNKKSKPINYREVEQLANELAEKYLAKHRGEYERNK